MMAWRRYIALGLAVIFLAGLRLAWIALTWSPEMDGAARAGSSGSGGKVVRVRRTAPPAAVPDLHDGYIFSPERVLDPAAAAAFGGGGVREARAGLDLDKLRYDGSIIIGDSRRALVSFPAKRRDPESGRDVEVIRNQVIEQGGEFRGYLVESVEPLRLVLSLNGERVIKPLYDKDKERTVPVFPGKAGGVDSAGRKQSQARPVSKPAPVRQAVSVPAVVRQEKAARRAPAAAPQNLPRSRRRMERLRMEHPEIIIPPAGGAVPALKTPQR